MSDNFVASLRELKQDQMLRELKEIKAELATLRTGMALANEALRIEILLRLDATDQHTAQLLRALADKLEYSVQVRERLAAIEARLPLAPCD